LRGPRSASGFHLSVFGVGYHVLFYLLFFNPDARLCAVILLTLSLFSYNLYKSYDRQHE